MDRLSDGYLVRTSESLYTINFRFIEYISESSRPYILQGSYSNNEIKFQDIPVWIELNFQDFSDSDVVYQAHSMSRVLQFGLYFL